MKRITESDFGSEARAIFSWITYACRPLTTNELSEAISVSLGESISEVHLDPEGLVAKCQGLVIVARDGTVLFVHKTVSDFLETQYSSHLFSPAEIAVSCLKYLGLDVFDEECLDEKSVRARVDTYKFISYAAVHWSDHVKKVEDDRDIQREVYSLFQDDIRRTAIRRTERYVTSGFEDIEIESLLVLMAEKGLSRICRLIVDGEASWLRYAHPVDR